MTLAAEQLERQCEIVSACESLEAAARELSALGAHAELLDLWRLPLVGQTVMASALAQAAALLSWAEQARPEDAVLARELRQAAELLSQAAGQAFHATTLARGFADSESPEELLEEGAR